MSKTAPRESPTPDAPSNTWQPGDQVAEDAIYRIFSVEMRNVLKRFAEAIHHFTVIVESHFQRHSTILCRVSEFDKPYARAAWNRVVALRGDAIGLLQHTVNHYGVGYPIPTEPLTCRPVARPKLPKGTRIPFRTFDHAEALGWLTPNESFLNGVLSFHGPRILEERDFVESRRLGMCSTAGPDGVPVRVACPDLAESDESIAHHFPLLVQAPLKDYAMAVADASLEQLRSKARDVLTWRPAMVRERELDPNWPCLRDSYLRVRQIPFRNRKVPENKPQVTHAPEFSTVCVNGVTYDLGRKVIAARVMAVLFDAARAGDEGVLLSELASKVKSRADRFRMEPLFRKAGGGYIPAFTALVEKVGRDRIRLREDVARIWRAK
jgi:hypothetical protein